MCAASPTELPEVTAPSDGDARRFPCEACGASMRYDPGTGMLNCDHCGNTEPLQDRHRGGAVIRELDFRAALEQQLPEAELETTQVLNCKNCGAQVEFEPAIHAAECPFCATPIVTGTGENRHIKPKGILPFVLDDKAAHEAMNKWLGRLWFAPNGLKKYARRGRKMDGIYVPYWTFDAQTQSAYAGQRGTVYYETRTVVIDGKRQMQKVAKIRWRPVRGRVERFFDDVLVLGSRSLPGNFAENLMPWDLAALEPYSPEYIAGLRAEAYTIELDDAFQRARVQMDRVIERDVRFDIGGDRQQVQQIDTKVSEVTFKHILLPVWVAAYRYGGKSYRFLVNGQTGRVQGERPWSVWKIMMAVIVVLLIAAALGYVYAVNQGGGTIAIGGGTGGIYFDPLDPFPSTPTQGY